MISGNFDPIATVAAALLKFRKRTDVLLSFGPPQDSHTPTPARFLQDKERRELQNVSHVESLAVNLDDQNESHEDSSSLEFPGPFASDDIWINELQTLRDLPRLYDIGGEMSCDLVHDKSANGSLQCDCGTGWLANTTNVGKQTEVRSEGQHKDRDERAPTKKRMRSQPDPTSIPHSISRLRNTQLELRLVAEDGSGATLAWRRYPAYIETGELCVLQFGRVANCILGRHCSWDQGAL